MEETRIRLIRASGDNRLPDWAKYRHVCLVPLPDNETMAVVGILVKFEANDLFIPLRMVGAASQEEIDCVKTYGVLTELSCCKPRFGRASRATRWGTTWEKA